MMHQVQKVVAQHELEVTCALVEYAQFPFAADAKEIQVAIQYNNSSNRVARGAFALTKDFRALCA